MQLPHQHVETQHLRTLQIQERRFMYHYDVDLYINLRELGEIILNT